MKLKAPCVLMFLLANVVHASSLEDEIERQLFNYSGKLTIQSSASLDKANTIKSLNSLKCLSLDEQALYYLSVSKPKIANRDVKHCSLVNKTGEWDVINLKGESTRMRGGEGLVAVNIFNKKEIESRINKEYMEGDDDFIDVPAAISSRYNWTVTTQADSVNLISSFPFSKKSNKLGPCKVVTNYYLMVITEGISITNANLKKIKWAEDNLSCEKYITLDEKSLFDMDVTDLIDINKDL